MGPVWDLFKASLGLAIDVTKNMVAAYLEFLKRLAKWCLLAALILLPLSVIGSLLHISWMLTLYLFVVGVIITVWLIAAFPIVMLMQYAYDEIKSIRRTAQLIGGILFWILLLAIYFYLVPIWNYPSAIPLIIIVCFIFALGFMRFGIGINPKLAIGVVFVIFFLTTVSFFMPTTRSTASTFVGWLDEKSAGAITSILRPAPQIPKRVAYDYASIEKITFFDQVTGEPKIWFYKGEDGKYELFDGPGYHPQYKTKLESITTDIVAQIKSQLKTDAEKVAQEEQRKKEEADRIVRQRQEERQKLLERAKEHRGSLEQKGEDSNAIVPTIKYEYKPPVFVAGFMGDLFFRIEVVSAKRVEESKLKFDVLIRSHVRGVRRGGLVDPEKTAYIIDSRGNRYGFLGQENLIGDFAEGVDMRGSITFLAPEVTERKINIIFKFKIAGGSSEVIFRNLDLDTLKLVEPITENTPSRAQRSL